MNNTWLSFTKLITTFLLMTVLSSVSMASGTEKDLLQKAIDAKHRDAKNVARDQYRHPKQTLEFFGIKPNMTVVEMWPGGQGWYTEILAPYLKEHGKYYAANFSPAAGDWQKKYADKFKAWIAEKPELYGDIVVTEFEPGKQGDIAPKASADMVLTFRNTHNWQGKGEEANQAGYQAIFAALKPGGILGVVQHKYPEGAKVDPEAKAGYMDEAYVIQLIESAGFKLVAKSDINANPKDTADHEKGVWTLPPVYSLKDKDKEKYTAIGESNRMTLKFIKPKS